MNPVRNQTCHKVETDVWQAIDKLVAHQIYSNALDLIEEEISVICCDQVIMQLDLELHE